MKLDRNLNTDGKGKYELRNLRTGKIVEDCGPGEEHEFFVIMLKDKHAAETLREYASRARPHDPEWADEVDALADRAGVNSPFCQAPD